MATCYAFGHSRVPRILKSYLMAMLQESGAPRCTMHCILCCPLRNDLGLLRPDSLSAALSAGQAMYAMLLQVRSSGCRRAAVCGHCMRRG